MLSTFIIENFAVVRVVLVIALIGTVVLAYFLARAPRHGRRTAVIITGVALAAVIGLTLTPDTYPLDVATCNFQSNTPFGDYLNIALFLLPAIFGVIATRKPLLVLAVGIGFSAFIELIQYLVPWFGRRCDVDDWLANSLGTLIGVAIGAAVLWVARRRAARNAA